MAVFLNLLVIFITMGVIAHSPPNYSVSSFGSAGAAVDPSTITPDPKTGEYPPIIHYGGLPDPNSLVGTLNGLLQGVFAYGGAQLFIEFMAEMRRPHDFIRAMWGAQFFIYAVYLIYGCYVYHFQGQYSYQVSYQGVSIYGRQTVGNMLAVLSGLIAAGLYGNIGIKCFTTTCLWTYSKHHHLPPGWARYLGDHCADMVVSCIRDCSSHPRLLWVRLGHFGGSCYPIHLFVPTNPCAWVQYPAPCNAG
jgi:hypothetical protein